MSQPAALANLNIRVFTQSGSKTEIGPRNPDFRSSLNSRHSPTRRSRPKSAINRLMQRSKNTWLTDQLVGAGAASEHPFRPSFFAVANHLIVVSIEQKRPPIRDRKNCKHVTDREQNDKRHLRIDTAWSGFSVATQVIAELLGS